MFNFAEELPPASPRYVLKLIAVSALAVSSFVLGYVLLNPEPPLPEGQLFGVRLYAPQPPAPAAETTPLTGSHSAPAPVIDTQQHTLLVLAPLKLHNTSNKSFSIFDLSATVDMGMAEYQSTSVSAEDFPRVFHYYPDLAVYRQAPLLRNTVLRPGETRSGLLVFNYPLTEEQWQHRTSFQVDVAFDHGKDVVLTDSDAPLLTALAQ